jgi:hypothetical protein
MGITKKALRIGDLVVPSYRAAAYTKNTHTLGIIRRVLDTACIVLVYWFDDGKTHHHGLSELRRINQRHKK